MNESTDLETLRQILLLNPETENIMSIQSIDLDENDKSLLVIEVSDKTSKYKHTIKTEEV